MKNTKLSLSLIACLLSIGGLAGCSKVKSSSDGVLLTYTVDGQTHKITANEILEKSYDDSSKYQAIYDIIYSVLVKNYFNKDVAVKYYDQEIPLGKQQMGSPNEKGSGTTTATIYARAQQKVDNDKETAHNNADANNTRYKKELDAIFESHGVETEAELKQKYVEELQKEVFEKNFYNYYIEDIKQGAGTTLLVGEEESKSKNLKHYWRGYFEDQMPYHVSHILIKLEDSAGTNYANGTISEENARNLYNVVADLGESNDSFSTIAKRYSEDPGSSALHGDLGIMDTSTSFVNEFKLGTYAYESYYGKYSAETEGTEIDAHPYSAKYSDAVEKSFNTSDELIGGVPVISKDVFENLNNVANVDKNSEDEEVLDNEATLYPRNIIYNKYLNRHSVAFITGSANDVHDEDASHGYHLYEDGSKLADVQLPILSVKVTGEWRPVLVVRAGGGDYQGIHFIVVNRSPLEKEAIVEEGEEIRLSQSEYYTTFYPGQDEYPHTGSVKDKNRVEKTTFVNFTEEDKEVSAATRKRAEEFASKLKSFDSDRLGKYIFQKYLIEEDVKIQPTKLYDSLMKWINTSVEKAAEERKENTSKTWNEYIDTLYRQGSERSKLIPQTCGIVYKKSGVAKEEVKSLTAALGIGQDYVNDAAFQAVMQDLVSLKYHETIYDETLEDYVEYSFDENTEASEVKEFLDKVTIKHAFNDKGGMCNDGKEHY